MLPDRKKTPGIPLGETPVMVNGRELIARFAKIAVNVLLDEGANVLTPTLQGMFGPDAGMPGTRYFVEFLEIDGRLHMRPYVPESDAS
ncbi:hypothetical protein [Microvirga massiliensis]|uniref:hypothetical protein n=1 Tax=Microvirga massiliensis TaxID=1033741 RepID=UPI0011CA4B43|nr:hypothetical protein [Microvirga massiliensis]